jgi:TPR repeat protein
MSRLAAALLLAPLLLAPLFLAPPLVTAGAARAQAPASSSAAATEPGRPEAVKAPVRPPDAAYGAYQRGLFLTALREATSRLERNPQDAAAMTLMGELHNQGLGVRQDPQKAADWYRLAVGRGGLEATFALAMMTLEGRGVARDEARARSLLDDAAKRGHPAASFNLALILLSGESESDHRRGAALMRVAADAEIAEAQHALGVMFVRGRGLPRDTGEAVVWFERAARNHHAPGEVELAILLFNGDGVAADEARAIKLFRRAAFRRNAIAQNRLARVLADGRGGKRDLVEAAAWHIAASRQGLSDTWLDQVLKGITDDERARAERLADERAQPF